MIVDRFLLKADADASSSERDADWFTLGYTLIDQDGLFQSSHIGKRDSVPSLDQAASLLGGIILAEGGSGKTTFLKRLQEQIGDTAKVFPLWQYSDASLEKAVYAFLETHPSGTLLFDALDENTDIAGPLARLVGDLADRPDVHVWIASRDIGQINMLVEKKNVPCHYRLAPLSQENIRALAKDAGVETEAFFTEVHKRGLLCVCAKPIGCTALLDKFKKTGGDLSDMGIRTFWRSLIERLLDQGPDKTHPAEFTLTDLSRAAGWIALFLSLAGKHSVWTTGKESECPPECLRLDSLIENEQGLSRALLLETLRRGVFAPEQGGKTRFVHESYKDFLAAEAFTYFALFVHWKTFFLSGDRRFVFPSRQEILGWCALENQEIRDHLFKHAPEALLASRELASVIGPANLCAALLARVKAKSIGREMQHNLKCHNLHSLDTLAFVKAELQKTDVADDTFDFLTEVARDCAFNDTELTSFLAGVVADRNRPSPQRRDASYTLRHTTLSDADYATLKALLPLTDADEDGTFSTIRGNILSLCWPDHLTDAEVEGLLSKPPTNGYGAYNSFLDRLPNELARRNRPELAVPCLRWAISHIARNNAQYERHPQHIYAACWRWACGYPVITRLLAEGWMKAAENMAASSALRKQHSQIRC